MARCTHGKETHLIVLIHHVLHQILRGDIWVPSELIAS
jgi:hypothetical protein